MNDSDMWKGHDMRVRSFLLIAATAILAACASEPEEFAASPAGSPTGSGTSANVAALPAEDPTSQEWLVTKVGDRVFFEYDKSNLTGEAQDKVEKLVAWMRAHPEVTLTLEGHADERGTREYNLALGERRANSVRRYIEALGMDGSRLSVISYGNEQPEVLGSNEYAWSQNRRAVFVVN